ncbi:MAG: hypothetical protein EBS71_08450 [Actinobacteria bacterium]|nr:hypothetical protein [Actinomycetota bacterium]
MSEAGRLVRIVASVLLLSCAVVVVGGPIPDPFQNAGVANASTPSSCAQTTSGLTVSTQVSGDYCILTFTAGSGTWTIPTEVRKFDLLVVGGGGGGGADAGGGGGGGAVYLGSVSLGAGTSRSASIVVGAGGLPKKWSGGSDAAGSAGGDSSFSYSDNGTLSVTAYGGGVGTFSPYNSTSAAGAGGTTPLASDTSSTSSATATVSSAGGAGGAGVTDGFDNTNTSTNAAKSGTGGQSGLAIFGGNYGGGGGGGATTVGGQNNLGGGGVNGGGNGAGGRGSPAPSSDYVAWFANAGTANSGGGGGAGAAHGNTASYSNGSETYISRDGKPGGTGVVKVRYSHFTVTYTYNSATGGNSTTSAVSVGDSGVTLPTPTRTGYTFAGWFTASSGGSSIGAAGASYVPTADITVHAQWTALTYSVTFYDTNSGSGGGGDGGSAPSVQSGSGVGSLTLSANTLSLSGYAFSGWATSNGSTTVAYADQGSVSITSNTTLNLYPVWTANTYTVTYDGNSNTSGSVPSVGSATYGSSFTVSANSGSLVRSGYSFSGWNTVANGSGTSFAAGSSSTWSIASIRTMSSSIQVTQVLRGPPSVTPSQRQHHQSSLDSPMESPTSFE